MTDPALKCRDSDFIWAGLRRCQTACGRCSSAPLGATHAEQPPQRLTGEERWCDKLFPFSSFLPLSITCLILFHQSTKLYCFVFVCCVICNLFFVFWMFTGDLHLVKNPLKLWSWCLLIVHKETHTPTSRKPFLTWCAVINELCLHHANAFPRTRHNTYEQIPVWALRCSLWRWNVTSNYFWTPVIQAFWMLKAQSLKNKECVTV